MLGARMGGLSWPRRADQLSIDAVRLTRVAFSPGLKVWPIEEVSAVPREKGRKVIASNRKARHDYAILDTVEAGLSLLGTEVKSLRAGRASLVDSFAQERDGELYLHGLHVPEYAMGTWTNHEPRRVRKLLLKRVEINRLITKIREDGLTVVPLSLYFSDGWAKVELGLARGKKSYDKRQDLARRDADREIHRALGRRNKGMG
jgi:SsrA-binding protein